MITKWDSWILCYTTKKYCKYRLNYTASFTHQQLFTFKNKKLNDKLHYNPW
jgi:hypothetical protein